MKTNYLTHCIFSLASLAQCGHALSSAKLFSEPAMEETTKSTWFQEKEDRFAPHFDLRAFKQTDTRMSFHAKDNTGMGAVIASHMIALGAPAVSSVSRTEGEGEWQHFLVWRELGEVADINLNHSAIRRCRVGSILEPYPGYDDTPIEQYNDCSDFSFGYVDSENYPFSAEKLKAGFSPEEMRSLMGELENSVVGRVTVEEETSEQMEKNWEEVYKLGFPVSDEQSSFLLCGGAFGYSCDAKALKETGATPGLPEGVPERKYNPIGFNCNTYTKSVVLMHSMLDDMLFRNQEEDSSQDAEKKSSTTNNALKTVQEYQKNILPSVQDHYGKKTNAETIAATLFFDPLSNEHIAEQYADVKGVEMAKKAYNAHAVQVADKDAQRNRSFLVKSQVNHLTARVHVFQLPEENVAAMQGVLARDARIKKAQAARIAHQDKRNKKNARIFLILLVCFAILFFLALAAARRREMAARKQKNELKAKLEKQKRTTKALKKTLRRGASSAAPASRNGKLLEMPSESDSSIV